MSESTRDEPSTPAVAQPDAPRRSSADSAPALLPPEVRSYAVVWSDGSDVCSGRLDVHRGGLDLHGRVGVLRLAFRDVNRASIERGRADRLRGLPVLRLWGRGGTSVRIASLQGPGVLHELAGHVESAGLTVAA